MGWVERAACGLWLFWATPRLRALPALTLAVAAGGAMVMVNTIVYVRDHLERGASKVPVALGAYVAGSIAAALLLPRLLHRTSDRTLMLPAALTSGVQLVVLAVLTASTAMGDDWMWPVLLGLWAVFGLSESVIMTPTGRLVRRSAAPDPCGCRTSTPSCGPGTRTFATRVRPPSDGGTPTTSSSTTCTAAGPRPPPTDPDAAGRRPPTMCA